MYKPADCQLTTKDANLLEVMLQRHGDRDGPFVRLLRRKLSAATVVFQDGIDARVATLNSRIEISVDGGPAESRILAYGGEDAYPGIALPITTLLGLSLLGLTAPRTIVCERPDGATEEVHLRRILHRGAAWRIPLPSRHDQRRARRSSRSLRDGERCMARPSGRRTSQMATIPAHRRHSRRRRWLLRYLPPSSTKASASSKENDVGCSRLGEVRGEPNSGSTSRYRPRSGPRSSLRTASPLRAAARRRRRSRDAGMSFRAIRPVVLRARRSGHRGVAAFST